MMMISSLFSMFDPTSSSVTMVVGKWVYLLVPAVGLLWSVFALPLGFSGSVVNVIFVLKGIVKQYSDKAFCMVMFLFVSLFTVIGWNEIGLIPFGFGVSSHLVSNLSLGLTFVVCGLIASICVSGTKKVIAHMVPYGAPLGLSFALAIIETVSFMIRPFTLSIRLTGNMITGHLLVALLYELVSSLFVSVLPVSAVVLVLGVGLLIFEMAVGVVQAIIFTILMLIYWSE